MTGLEEETSKVYNSLALKCSHGKEVFELFSRENKKYKTLIEKAYYGVISDALEACFSFEVGYETDEYRLKIKIPDDSSFHDLLQSAIKIESTIQKAYNDAANLSEKLMADIPQAFKTIAKKREERISKIKTLMEKTN